VTQLSGQRVLELALEAHGGVQRWHGVKQITATLSLTGALFDLMGQPGGLGRTHATARAGEPVIEFEPFATADHGLFRPDQVSVRRDGQTLDRRTPRQSFDGHGQWDDSHLLYFTGYAIWNYLCTPFLLTWPGFTVEALEPWIEGSETWRRLDVTFPPAVPTHNPTQRFYFDRSGLLRRLDYQPEVLGEVSAPVAHYCDDHRDFDGFVVPTHRRVYLRRDDDTAARESTVVELDVEDVRVDGF
jgi:hypothetical protein